MKRTNYPDQRRRGAAFTLIEMLVVIAIIAILAALIFPVMGAITRKKQITLAQSELQQLETAIDGYHTKLGFYPPDNATNSIVNPLYFELLGTTNNTTTTVGATQYGTLDGSAYILTSDILAYFGTNSLGLANSSTRAHNDDQGTAASTFLTHLLPNQYAPVDPVNKPQLMILVCPVAWPSTVQPLISSNPTLNPWRYSSSHPTNNVGSYDLWVDLVIKGKTNRICNWSATPIQL